MGGWGGWSAGGKIWYFVVSVVFFLMATNCGQFVVFYWL